MTKWLAMLMACLALGLVVAGCGDDDDDDGGGGAAETTEQPAETEEDTGGAPAGGGTTEVTIKDFAFNPKDVTVDKGTTITWTNEDSAGHDVTKTGGAGPDFSSGDPGGLSQGDTYEETFDAAGKIDYVCTVHPQMTASITVK
jgi:plastocyanin